MFLAGLFALSALSAFLIHLMTAPTVLRLAVGPIGSDDVRMAAAFVQSAAREKGSIRIKLVLTEGLAESAKALEEDRADLAIVRPDIAMPPKGETLLITRRFFPFFVSSRDRRIERIADLRGRKVGVVDNPKGNVDLLKLILAFYEIPLDQVEIVGLTPQAIPQAAAEGRIDAMFAVGAATSRAANQPFMRQVWGVDPVFIPIREADALASRYRAIEPGEVVRGAFGGDPPRPAEPLTTISVTHRLIADEDLSEAHGIELTRLILTQRTTLAADVPAMQGIEAPATAKDAALPVHAGAAAYIDGNERSFFDRYGDWFYLGVMAMSLLGSVAAAFLSQATTIRRRNAMEGLKRLMVMIGEVRATDAFERIDELEREADQILAATLDQMAKQNLDDAGLSAYRLAMDQFGRAAAERRRALLDMSEHAAGVT